MQRCTSYTGCVRALYDLEAKRSIGIETVHVIKMDQNGAVTDERWDHDFPPPSGTLAGIAVHWTAVVMPVIDWTFEAAEQVTRRPGRRGESGSEAARP